MTIRNTILGATGALVLLATPAYALLGFDVFDADRDGYVNREEAYAGLDNGGYYNTYDANSDGFLEPAEFGGNEETFGLYDADRDGRLTRDEYYNGVYTAADDNDDDLLDTNEFGIFSGFFA